MKCFALFLVLCLLVPARAVLAKKQKLSTQQIQVLQTKDFKASCPLTFRAVMNALQANNLQVKEADPKAGFIYSQSGGKRSFMMGTVKNVDTSITFDELSQKQCRVRANFFEVTKKNSAGFLSVLTTAVGIGTGTYTGTGMESGYEQAKLVTSRDVYQRFYETVNKNLFIKESLNR